VDHVDRGLGNQANTGDHDTLLRLAVWLADVAAEAATAVASGEAPVTPQRSTSPAVAQIEIRSLVGPALR